MKAEHLNAGEGATHLPDTFAHQPHRGERIDPRNKIGTAGPEFAMMLYEARLAGKRWVDIRDSYGVDRRTAQAILSRHTKAAEWLTPARKRFAMWSRPCIRCGAEERRRKGLFMCKSCRRTVAEDDYCPDEVEVGGWR